MHVTRGPTSALRLWHDTRSSALHPRKIPTAGGSSTARVGQNTGTRGVAAVTAAVAAAAAVTAAPSASSWRLDLIKSRLFLPARPVHGSKHIHHFAPSAFLPPISHHQYVRVHRFFFCFSCFFFVRTGNGRSAPEKCTMFFAPSLPFFFFFFILGILDSNCTMAPPSDPRTRAYRTTLVGPSL